MGSAIVSANAGDVEQQLAQLEQLVATRQYGNVREMGETVDAMKRVLASAHATIAAQRDAIATLTQRAEHSEDLVVALKAHVRRLQQENGSLQNLIDTLSTQQPRSPSRHSSAVSLPSARESPSLQTVEVSQAAAATAAPAPRKAATTTTTTTSSSSSSRSRRGSAASAGDARGASVARLEAEVARLTRDLEAARADTRRAHEHVGSEPAVFPATPAKLKQEQKRVNEVLRTVLDQRDAAIDLLQECGIAVEGSDLTRAASGGGLRARGQQQHDRGMAQMTKEIRTLRRVVEEQQGALFYLRAIASGHAPDHRKGRHMQEHQRQHHQHHQQQQQQHQQRNRSDKRGRSFTSIYAWAADASPAEEEEEQEEQERERHGVVGSRGHGGAGRTRAVVATEDAAASATLLKAKQLEVDLLREITSGLRAAIASAITAIADSSAPAHHVLSQALRELQSRDIENAPAGYRRMRTAFGLEFYASTATGHTTWWHPSLAADVAGADVYAPFAAPIPTAQRAVLPGGALAAPPIVPPKKRGGRKQRSQQQQQKTRQGHDMGMAQPLKLM